MKGDYLWNKEHQLLNLREVIRLQLILFVLLYIGVAICVNISLYKAIKESCESKDWEFMAFCLMMLLAEILAVQAFAVMLFTD